MLKTNLSRLHLLVVLIFMLGVKHTNATEPLSTQKTTTQGQLKVLDAWVRLTPPVVKNSAAYFVLHNTGQEDIKVTGVSSVAARSAMMHDSVVENGVASMVHLADVIVPAGQKVEFEPGGRHIMLIGLSEKLKKDKKLPIVFQLQNGETVGAEMLVR